MLRSQTKFINAQTTEVEIAYNSGIASKIAYEFMGRQAINSKSWFSSFRL